MYTKAIAVLLVEDDPWILAGLRAVLLAHAGIRIVGETMEMAIVRKLPP